MASDLSSYLPPSDGLLPKWLLFISIVSIGNSIQAYSTLSNTRELYAGSSPNPTAPNVPGAAKAKTNTSLPDGIPSQTIASAHASPVTALSARTFGTWTALSAVVRLYGAYHIHNAAVYEITLWTYVVAWLHFVSEWLVFGTARLNRAFVFPLLVANGTLLWMWMQWGYYVK